MLLRLVWLLGLTLALQIQFAPSQIAYNESINVVSAIFGAFEIQPDTLARVRDLLSERELGLQGVYTMHYENDERIQKMLPLATDPDLQLHFFPLDKLFIVPLFARYIFVEQKCPYTPSLAGNMPQNATYHASLFEDCETLGAMVRYLIEHQFSSLESLDLLRGFTKRCPPEDLADIFDLLVPEMFPEILHLFILERVGDANVYIRHFLTLEEDFLGDLFYRIVTAALAVNETLSNVSNLTMFQEALERLDPDDHNLAERFIKSLDIHMLRKGLHFDMYEALESVALISEQRAVWGTLARVVNLCPDYGINMYECQVLASRFLKNAPEDLMLPIVTRQIGQTYVGTDQQHWLVEYFSCFSPLHIPRISLPLEHRLKTWYNSGVFFRISTQCPVSNDSRQIWMHDLVKLSTSSGQNTPINLNFVDSHGTAEWIGTWFMEFVSEWSKNSEKQLETSLLVLASWPFLILCKKRLNLSFLFSRRNYCETWEDFTSRIVEYFAGSTDDKRNIGESIERMLHNCHFSTLFTPEEVASLIDESFVPLEASNSFETSDADNLSIDESKSDVSQEQKLLLS